MLAEYTLQAQNEQYASQSTASDVRAVNSFPGLSFIDDEIEEGVIEDILYEDKVEIFYLWDISYPIFELYKILRNYSRNIFVQIEGTSHPSGQEINEPILIELIKANHLDMVTVLHDIPYLHSEYSSVMREASKDNG